MASTLQGPDQVIDHAWSGQVHMSKIFAGVDDRYDNGKEEDQLKAVELGQQVQIGAAAGTYKGNLLKADGSIDRGVDLKQVPIERLVETLKNADAFIDL